LGKDRPHHEIDLVAFEQAFDLGHRAVRLEFVIDHHDLDVAAGHLAAEILDREREAVADLLPSAAAGPDKVTITPILSFSCATACPAERLNRTPVGQPQLMFHDFFP